MRDYYEILGIGKNATDEEIKKAYRKLAHEHHPDKKGGNTEKFKEINEAYQTLSDKNKRSQYDRFGSANPFNGSGFEGFHSYGAQGFDGSYSDLGDLGEIFDSFFEGLGVKPKKKTYQRGADIEVGLEITLEEAFRGIVKKFKISSHIRCEACSGKGADSSSGFTACNTCAGQGEIKEQSRTFFGSFYQVKPCQNCHGQGQIPNKICAVCHGSGRKSAEREVSVEILPGIQDNQIIQLKKMGEAGERGAAEGDLYLRIRIKSHSMFYRQGDDLITRKELNIVDLLLGKKIEITTVQGGKINLDIPTHFNLREDLKIKGEGMPHFGSYGKGDMFVKFLIRAPKKPNSKAKKLLEDLEKEL